MSSPSPYVEGHHREVHRSETRATLRKSLFFPGNREIFLKNRDAIERQTGQSLREIRDLDDFCEGKITEKKQGGNREETGGVRGFPVPFFGIRRRRQQDEA